MITAIFSAIAAVPKILALVEKLIAFMSDQLDQAKKRQALEDLEIAERKAKEKKDTSDMDSVFDPRKKK